MGSMGDFSTIEQCTAAIEDDGLAFAPRYHLISLLRAQGRLDEALEAADAYLSVAPRSAQGFALIAGVYRAMGDVRRAAAAGATAVEIEPTLLAALVDLAADLHELGDYPAALAFHDRALSMMGDTPVAALVHTNAGRSAEACGEDARAVIHYRAAISLLPRPLPDLHLMLSHALLRAGRYREAWPHLTYRTEAVELRALGGSAARYLGRIPRWQPGMPLSGKRVLVGHEQGYGDAIMMYRFVPMLAERGAIVTLETLPELKSLARTLGGCHAIVLGTQAAVPAHDVDLYVPLFDLPYALDVTLSDLPLPPYVSAEVERVGSWAERLPQTASLRVGLVWQAGYLHQTNTAKSIGFEALQPLLDIEGVSWYGLQKGIDELAPAVPDSRVTSLGVHLRDFADTAAAIAQLDLVITIDTSVAHLAGALGKPVWTLLSEPADWRWMRTRGDSPWYPSMRLFRQAAPGDWTQPLADVKAALAEVVISRSGMRV